MSTLGIRKMQKFARQEQLSSKNEKLGDCFICESFRCTKSGFPDFRCHARSTTDRGSKQPSNQDQYYINDGDQSLDEKDLTIGGYESAWLADLVAAYILAEVKDFAKLPFLESTWKMLYQLLTDIGHEEYCKVPFVILADLSFQDHPDSSRTTGGACFDHHSGAPY